MSSSVSKSPSLSPPTSSGWTFTGWHMLFMIVGFFGIIVAVNVFMVVRAVQTFPGEDIKQSYRQGLEYNQTLDKRAVQRAREWHADISVLPDHSIVLKLTDKSGLPVRGLTVTGLLKHPGETDLDTVLSFTLDAQSGHYTTQVADGITGKRWLVTKAVYAGAEAQTPAFETRNELWLK